MQFWRKNDSAYIFAQLSKVTGFEQELKIINRLVVGPKFVVQFGRYEHVERFMGSIPYLHRQGTVTYARPWNDGFHLFTGGKISDAEAIAVMEAIRSRGSGQKGTHMWDWTPPGEYVTEKRTVPAADRRAGGVGQRSDRSRSGRSDASDRSDHSDSPRREMASAGARRPSIGRLKARKSGEGLIKALAFEDPWVRYEAAEALGELGDPCGVDALITALGDTHADRVWRNDELRFDVRSAAAQALAKIRDPRAVEPLIRLLESLDESSSIDRDVVQALGAFGDARALEPLKAALRHPSRYVRSDAAEALRRLGHEAPPGESLSHAYEAMGAESAASRSDSAKELLDAGPEGLRLLGEALRDDNSNRYLAASWAIKYGHYGGDREDLAAVVRTAATVLARKIEAAELQPGVTYFSEATVRTLDLLELYGDETALPALRALLRRVKHQRQADGYRREYVNTGEVHGWIDNDGYDQHVQRVIDAIRDSVVIVGEEAVEAPAEEAGEESSEPKRADAPPQAAGSVIVETGTAAPAKAAESWAAARAALGAGWAQPAQTGSRVVAGAKASAVAPAGGRSAPARTPPRVAPQRPQGEAAVQAQPAQKVTGLPRPWSRGQMVAICLGALLSFYIGFGFAMYGFAQPVKRRQAALILAVTIMGLATIWGLTMFMAG